MMQLNKGVSVKKMSGATPYQTYAWAFQSANRDEVQFPDTNEFTLPMHMSIKNPQVASISLGSLELEPSQWTVEEEWSMLYVDEGVPPFTTSAARTLELREVRDGSVWPVSVQLPMSVNTVKSVTINHGTQPVSATIVTGENHGLSPAMIALWESWGGSVFVRSKDVTMQLQSTMFVDRGPTTFTIPWAESLNPNDTYELVATRVPSPTCLALAINLAAKQRGSSISVTYHPTETRFSFRSTRGTASQVVTNAQSSELGTSLGLASCSALPLLTEHTKAPFVPRHVMGIRIEPGNYTPQELAAELSAKLNRGMLTDNGIITASDGVHTYRWIVPGGKGNYTLPAGKHLSLGALIDAITPYEESHADANMNPPSLIVQVMKGYAVISLSTNVPFSLTFDRAETAALFGFHENMSLRGMTMYVSNICMPDLDVPYLSNTYNVVYNDKNQSYTFNVSNEPNVQDAVAFNLYLGANSGPNKIHARYLGFPSSTMEFIGERMITSTYAVDLSPVKYILFDITNPAGMSRVQTSNKTENRIVMAKIILTPYYKLERADIMQLDVTGISALSEISFRLLNPDFTPYKMHGKNWSGSLMFSILQLAPLLTAS